MSEALSPLAALERFVEAYAAEYHDDGYDVRDMVDYVVNNSPLKQDLEVLMQKEGIGWPALAAWYEGRAAYIRRNIADLESNVLPGAPNEEQRARRGKVCC